MNLAKRKLGLMVSTGPEHANLDTALGLGRAALDRGAEVYLYLIDDGVTGVEDARVQGLAERGAKLFVCAYGCQKRRLPLSDHGKPGSLLDIALANHIHLEHNCGGSCACTTCHVVVREGEENLSTMEQDEEDRLDTAEGLTLHSRLGCQAVVRGDVVVEIPK